VPELVTHTLTGWLLARGLKPRLRRLDPLPVVVGCCLPDWLSHGFIFWPGSFEYVGLLQEPLPLLLACALIGSFARAGRRLAVGGSLAAGALLHYLLDLLQQHAFPTCRPLFPFSGWTTGIHLYPVESSIYVAPLLLLLALGLELRRRRRAS
jgi:membrane-bound metal-dependent hydrolase YbcI (DUF457 family)